jgi:hypothetical protein
MKVVLAQKKPSRNTSTLVFINCQVCPRWLEKIGLTVYCKHHPISLLRCDVDAAVIMHQLLLANDTTAVLLHLTPLPPAFALTAAAVVK